MNTVDRIDIPKSEKEKLNHYTIFAMIGVPALAAFSLYHLAKADYLMGALTGATVISVIFNWFILIGLNRGRIVNRVSSSLYFCLLLYMVFKGGAGGSKILWMYTVPLIAFFLLGRKEGLFWAGIVFIVTFILLVIPAGWLGTYPYHGEFKFRFFASFVIVSTITYWFEYLRQRYQMGMQQEQRRLYDEITERKKVQKEKEQLIKKLQSTLEEVKTLQGLIPICSHCHSIRDDKGSWNRLEAYIQRHSDAEFSHGICPSCKKKLYPDLYPEE